jgi:hypothetical protein
VGRYLVGEDAIVSVSVTEIVYVGGQPVTQPVDPDTITLTVYEDDGLTIAAGPFTSPTHDDVGEYHQAVPDLPAGNNYQGVWRTTGPGKGTTTVLFDMVPDIGAPIVALATFGQLTEGALADLVEGIDSATAQLGLMAEATTACESVANRRLAPFVGLVESHRLDGVDPDEYPAGSGLPITLETMGRGSLGTVLGVGDNLVRHLWLDQYAPRYADLWAYSDVTVTLTDTAGAVQTLAGAQLLAPEPDSGHLWLPVGTWAPVGSHASTRYSGGYQTSPPDLVRACKYMAAAIAADELDPLSQRAGALRSKAEHLLQPYQRT